MDAHNVPQVSYTVFPATDFSLVFRLFSLFVLVASRCSRLFATRYSGFPDAR